MIQTVVVPESNELHLILPLDYIGKNLNVICYSDEEVNNIVSFPNVNIKKKPSDFIGTLSKEEGEKMQEYVIKSRSEWNRDI